MTKKGFLKIEVGEKILNLDLILYDDDVPKTVQNFVHFLQERTAEPSEHQLIGYLNSSFHRIIPGFMVQGGDFVNGDGTGSRSIYNEGGTFADENFMRLHDRPGILSMANSGKDTNGSQFFITFRPTPHLDNKHVVFGHVDLTTSSKNHLKILEHVKTDRDDRPMHRVQIVDCGIATDDIKEQSFTKKNAKEENITTIETSEGNNVTKKATKSKKHEIDSDKFKVVDELPKTKEETLRQRLRQIKMKMNQARQLNKQEVLREGERLGSVEGAVKARKRQQAKDRKSKELEWKYRNSKAFEVATTAGLDGKYLVEQADSSVKNVYKKEENASSNTFGINDHFNPEGMHRNYERDLRSIPRAAGTLTGDVKANDTFNPISTNAYEQRERKGARNLANEMKRRIEKQKSKRDRIEHEGEDVTWINQRNKKFNQKISRNFDTHTAGIRQNLERGTAL